MRFPFIPGPTVDRHTHMVVPQLPAMGWTILRAAYAVGGHRMYRSTQGGYQVPKYGYGDNVGIQVEGLDGSVILPEGSYTLFYLAAVHIRDKTDEIDQRPGMYDDRFQEFEAQLLPAIEWMRENDPLPPMFSEPRCDKGNICVKDVHLDDGRGAYVCPEHGRLKAAQVRWEQLSPFDKVRVPKLPF